ncbi:MAG: hypothetical protein XD72_2014 [Methanothrix harundinacea]|jgi:hypothetical protein|uniref:Uncharacterized protein n=1 Tax=Methanothrix harundinacea TaxID=301375 RepID=A0A101FSK8_9EURY|nr:MAG: hypothetical protein XD72_2014 [Methanothrix harundinacea]
MCEYLGCSMDNTCSNTCCDQDPITECHRNANAAAHMWEEGGQV